MRIVLAETSALMSLVSTSFAPRSTHNFSAFAKAFVGYEMHHQKMLLSVVIILLITQLRKTDDFLNQHLVGYTLYYIQIYIYLNNKRETAMNSVQFFKCLSGEIHLSIVLLIAESNGQSVLMS